MTCESCERTSFIYSCSALRLGTTLFAYGAVVLVSAWQGALTAISITLRVVARKAAIDVYAVVCMMQAARGCQWRADSAFLRGAAVRFP